MDYAGRTVGLTCERSIFGATLLGLISLVAACRRDAPPPPPSDAALDVTFAGCAAVILRDSRIVCELTDPRELRLVVPRAAQGMVIEAAFDEGAPKRVLVPRSAEDDALVRHRVDVPAGATRVVVRATVDGRAAAFGLDLGASRKLAWLDEAKALRAKGELASARAVADAHAATGDEAERSAAKDLLARITLAEGHAEQAFALFREAILSHRTAGRVSEAVDDSFALAFALHQRSHRYDEARAALDAIASDVKRYPEGRAREPYYRGILASESGDRRAALALLRDAEARARALGMTRLERNARAALALEMQALGRARESLELLRALERDPEVKGCERVEVANDLGWGALLANEAAGDRREDARAPLERAVAVEGCSDVYLKSFALGNLARLALGEGDAERAKKLLDQARASVREPRGSERLSWLDLEARILLAQRAADRALARFDEELALARAGVALEPEWSALVGRAEAQMALGRRAEAAAALLAAEDVVDRAMLLVPLGEGRGAFVADRSRSARSAVELLVTLGRADEAARVARRSRGRVLGSVERALRIERLGAEARTQWESSVRSYRAAREALDAEAAGDWKLPADALARATGARMERERALRVSLEAALAVLAPQSSDNDAGAARAERPGVGDLELLVHPGETGWLAIVIDSARTTSHRVPEPDGAAPAALASALLEPIAARIALSRRVRVRAFGAWRRVDVHALPFRGEPLLASVAVDYPIGLRGAPSTSFDRRALVIGDPSSNLPAAREEAVFVANAVGAQMPAQLLLGPEATSRAVTARLGQVGLLHYAGHGIFAGAEGWESALPLAEGGLLSIGDLLALAPAPRKVVLSGCDAARSTGGAEGLGLAQAMVAAGAEEVLAPTRPVADTLARSLAEALYAGSAADAVCDLAGEGALAGAVRTATSVIRAREPAADWSAFRVLAR